MTSSCLVAASFPRRTPSRSSKRELEPFSRPGAPLEEIVDWIHGNVKPRSLEA